MPGNRAGEIRRDDIQAKRQLGPERYREGCRLLRPMVFPIHEHLTHQAPPPRTRGALSSLRIACDRAIIRDMRAKIKGFARICPSCADFWVYGELRQGNVQRAPGDNGWPSGSEVGAGTARLLLYGELRQGKGNVQRAPGDNDCSSGSEVGAGTARLLLSGELRQGNVQRAPETTVGQAVRKWERARPAFLRTPGAWDGAQEVCQLMPES